MYLLPKKIFFCSKYANFLEKSAAFIERCATCANQKCIPNTISCRFMLSFSDIKNEWLTPMRYSYHLTDCTLPVIRLQIFNISFIWYWADSCQYSVYNIYQVKRAGLNFRMIMTNIFKDFLLFHPKNCKNLLKLKTASSLLLHW